MTADELPKFDTETVSKLMSKCSAIKDTLWIDNQPQTLCDAIVDTHYEYKTAVAEKLKNIIIEQDVSNIFDKNMSLSNRFSFIRDEITKLIEELTRGK